MSFGQNYRLAIATRGYRGGGLGTRYVNQDMTVEETHEVLNINTSIETISADISIEEIGVVSASIEVS